MGRPAKAKAQSIEERQAEVARLLRLGYSERDIAREVGCSKTTAHGDIEVIAAELASSRIHDTEQARAMLADKLAVAERLVLRIISEAEAEDAPIALAATDRLIRLHERYAKLYGLDAATEVLVTQRLESELAAVVEALRGALDDAAFTKALAALGVSSAEGAGEPAEDSDATGRPDPVP